MYNHNKAQQSKNRVHISWDILYVWLPNATSSPILVFHNGKYQYTLGSCCTWHSVGVEKQI